MRRVIASHSARLAVARFVTLVQNLPSTPGVEVMEQEFWLERWERNEIGFHLRDVNPRLAEFWHTVAPPAGKQVFVPLCGKSLDLHWLASQGHGVVGVELSDTAVRAFFDEAGLSARLERERLLTCHATDTIRLYCGDIMELTVLDLHGVAAVYDRAALVALPPRMRANYVDHVLRIIPDGATILLVTFEYDQSLISGPPHAVLEDEVQALYGQRCEIERLSRRPLAGLPPTFAAAGVTDANETVYRIVKQR